MPVSQSNIDLINTLQTKAEVQAVIDEVQKLKDDSDYVLLSEDRKADRMNTLGATVTSDIASAQAEKASYATVIPTLPASNEVRKTLEEKVVTLDYRLFQLNQRKMRIGKGALILVNAKLQNEQENNQNLTHLLGALDAKKTALTA